MSLKKLMFLILLVFPLCNVFAQQDSILDRLQKLPIEYFKETENKIDKYSRRISNKTEKTLIRLAKWETKVQAMLQKVNPEAAGKLFAKEQLTFKGMLAQYKKGEASIQSYRSSYDEYRDKLSTQFKYLDSNKNLLTKNAQQLLAVTKAKTEDLNKEEEQNEALQKMIRERKKQLVEEALKHLGKNKYLQKMNKETYYYVETLKNYKQIFKDKTKREETAKKLLEKIPAFKEFLNKVGVGSIIGSGPLSDQGSSTVDYAAMGYQSNATITQALQQRPGGGFNVQQLMGSNPNPGFSALQELKNRFPQSNSTEAMPDFKPNDMRSKLFRQRLEFGGNLQFGKANNFMPGGLDIGLQVAYKLNNNSSAGFGAAYKVGLGKSIDKIKLSTEGIGLRSFIDRKLKGKIFLNAGLELNYQSALNNIADSLLPLNTKLSAWKPAGVAGISKKYAMGKIRGSFIFLYDFLHASKLPASKPFIFRYTYNF